MNVGSLNMDLGVALLAEKAVNYLDLLKKLDKISIRKCYFLMSTKFRFDGTQLRLRADFC